MTTTKTRTAITVEAVVNAPVAKVWKIWTHPFHIMHWNSASKDWHTPKAENDVKPGGSFIVRMEARDGSSGFDFGGIYNQVKPLKLIEYTMGDGRNVKIDFNGKGLKTHIVETFEAEETNTVELQRGGWQSILDNFKKYAETADADNIHFEISINANVEKVYKTMLDEKYYTEWTKEFNPDSYFKGSWAKGTKILFIGTDEDGNKGGMVSRIKENIPNQFVSIEHLGILKNDDEITSGPEVEAWAGALENYTFTLKDHKTILTIEVDSNEEFKSFFMETWPKALNKLKSICEA